MPGPARSVTGSRDGRGRGFCGPLSSPAGGWMEFSQSAGHRAGEGLPSSRRHHRYVPRPIRRGVPHGCASRLYTASMAFALNSGTRHSLLPPLRAGPLTTPQASRHATDRIVAPPYRAFDAGLRPRPFPGEAASLLPGHLAPTRTGLTPAGDDELVEHEDPPWHYVTVSPPAPLGARTIEARDAEHSAPQRCRRGIAAPQTAGVRSAWRTPAARDPRLRPGFRQTGSGSSCVNSGAGNDHAGPRHADRLMWSPGM